MMMMMSSRIWCGHHSTPLSHHRHDINQHYITQIRKLSPSFSSLRKNLNQFHFSVDTVRLCSVNGDHNAYSLSDSRNSSVDHEGSEEENENRQGESLTSNEILTKLKRYGISGVLSYGLLNTAYYLCTFLVVWFYIAPAPGKMGYFAAVERFLKLMAMVWAGSQVTKLLRAGGALALAPFVDRGLSWFTTKFKFESQGKAFMAIVGFCFGLAIIVFLIVTLLWAYSFIIGWFEFSFVFAMELLCSYRITNE